jgi:hypothetical protein
MSKYFNVTMKTPYGFKVNYVCRGTDTDTVETIAENKDIISSLTICATRMCWHLSEEARTAFCNMSVLYLHLLKHSEYTGVEISEESYRNSPVFTYDYDD